jgi:zona occludens toxin
MIYLLTGVPRSGKSLYAVSTLLQKLISQKFFDEDGVEHKRRLCVDGIKGLLLPHEVMAPGVKTKDSQGVVTLTPGEGNGVWNWWEWCKPGDVIFIDEVQHWWRPRGMGTKPPQMIAELEEHGHLGVDFVLITQNPMLIDQNVRRLVGSHKNVRRLLGLSRAIIYDWDACAADVTRTKTATSSYWRYPKSAYKLYESSVLHLKQEHKIPLWLAVPVLAVVAGLFVAPMAFGTLSGAMTGKGVSSAKASDKKKEVSLLPDVTAGVALPTASAAFAPASVASSTVASEPVKPLYVGCIASKSRCTCYDDKASAVVVPEAVCSGLVVGASSVPKSQIDAVLSRVPDLGQPVSQLEQSTSDASVLAFMAGR